MISTAKHGLRERGTASVYVAGPQGKSQSLSIRRFFHASQRLAFMLLMAGLLVGCDLFGGGKDDDPTLDQVLQETLAEAGAASTGMESFKMPESTDFASIPQDPNNPLTTAKVELGQLLYHETGLLTDNVRPEGRFTASCSSCHHAKAGFQAGRVQGIGEGGFGFGTDGSGRVNDPNYAIEELDIQPIRTPSAMNGAYQIVNLWNGQFGATGPNAGTEDRWTPDTPLEANTFGYEGLESQAIGGMVAHRMSTVDSSLVINNATYIQMFEEAFPGQPIDREHTGLAIAAFERTMLSNKAPFQRWLNGNNNAMSEAEKRGAIVFFGKAGCVDCHNGPALNSMTFYALGMNNLDGPGVYGDHSEAEANLGRASFTGRAEDEYKFKTPQLYNLVDSPFFGHGGNFRSVREIVEYKNTGIPQNAEVPASQLASQFKPLNLTSDEVNDLVAFIEGGLYDADLERYVPASLPTGQCLVVNDLQSKSDLGCS